MWPPIRIHRPITVSAGGLLLCSVYGYTPHYLVAREAGVVVGLLPLMMVTSPWSGPHLTALPFSHRVALLATPAARPRLLAAAQQLARDKGARYLELREDVALIADAGFAPAAAYWQSILDMRAPSETLWLGAQFDTAQCRARRARRCDGAQRAGRGRLQCFDRLMLETRRHQGTPPYPRHLFDELARLPWTRLYLADDAQGATLAGPAYLHARCAGTICLWRIEQARGTSRAAAQ